MVRLRFFNEIAQRWDELHPASAQSNAIRRGLDWVEPLAGRRVVDVGCGTGVLIPHLLSRLGEQGSLVALDFSSEMVARARQRYPDPRIRWANRDVLDSGIESGSVDVVLCYNSFPHLNHRTRVLDEWARWLRPGGLALVWHENGREQIAALHKRVGGPIGGDVLPEAAELAEQFRLSGFRVRLAEEIPTAYAVLAERLG
jgi:ubiquinone/menaquinone biosynthesis C-methylase UbiE